MPCNVTMESYARVSIITCLYHENASMTLTPDARVVSLDLQDHIRRCAIGFGAVQNVDVTALRILGVDDIATPGAIALCKHMHVVTVVVHTATESALI